MKKISIIYIILFVSCNIAFSQSQSKKKGDKYYHKFNYSKAVKYYESLDAKDHSLSSLRNQAHSYHMLGDDAQALATYEKVIASKESSYKDYLQLAFYQRLNLKYDEAARSMEEYISKGGSGEIRAADFTLNKSKITTLKTDNGNATLKNIDINSSAQDFGVAYYNNEVIYVSSNALTGPVQRKWNGNKLNYLNIYKAKPENGQIKTAQLLRASEINRKYHDGPACFSADGKTMVFTRNNYNEKSSDKTTNLELYFTEMKDDEWQQPKPFPYNNKEYSVGHPSLSKDGNTLYFSSDMPGGKGGTDIYTCNRNKDGSWDKPVNLGDKINTEGNEMFPYIHPEGTLFFSSDGRTGLGGLDIFVAQSAGNSFSNCNNIGAPINSEKDDFAFILDQTLKNGFLSSNRSGGKGDDDIYSFTLKNPLRFGKVIKGIAYDKSGPALSGTIVRLNDASGKEIATITVGENGAYQFPVEDNQTYLLNGTKENYFGDKENVSTAGNESVIEKDLYLEKDPGFSLYLLVTDKDSRLPLENVTIKIKEVTGNSSSEIITPATGDMRMPLQGKKLNDQITYTFVMQKEGYLTKEFKYTKNLNRPGEYKIHEEMDVSMVKIGVGADLAEVLKINPIYFDLNKYNIRKDAAVELEKIIKVMNENPGIEIELGSHTDCRSSVSYNQKLSQNRAAASAEYIKKRITNPERIYGKGYGESKLKNNCSCEGAVKSSCSEAEHQLNRRTEFVIVKM